MGSMRRSSNISRRTILDSHYALAHAKLALAYTAILCIRRIPAALDLAYGNCQVALSLEPGLPDGHLALAWVFQQTGNQQGALNEIDRALHSNRPTPVHWFGRRRFTLV